MIVSPIDRLSTAHLDDWIACRDADPAFDSPYFHPGFATAVHRTGHEVQVAVEVDAGGRGRAFLPVHRRGSLATPVGSPAADFQGPVRASDATVALTGLMVALRVQRLAFDHVPATANGFAPWTRTTCPSPFMDVSGGMDGYLSRASRSGRDNMGQARRRTRKAERDLGAVEFHADSDDPALLDRVIDLKRGQYAATGAKDYFTDPRHVRLLHELLSTREEGFRGSLSAVFAGGQLVAAHFGLRSAGVLHWWFPVYEPDLSAFAPGWILLRELVTAAPELGLVRIDLGRGTDEYKRRAMTGATDVAQGTVTVGATSRAVQRVRSAAITGVRNSPAAPALRQGIRLLRQLRSTGGQTSARSGARQSFRTI
ncbi:GNAT family N-acetyltransferase [Pseudonocardia sp. 73-21]|uniref:GNAT family N-acetyltransferase n=1 Tax=Pseudonocardia sp. 73-21 TaxID=1895809 RepID=UPI000A556F2E|nr:GNAT family N-acetyltransferase [Pseudonocardia sp. 73-21]